ncbi:hypothetical protein AX16_001289 [Volvariella volvacea WC 439]|nr:hypothetical protein AX16_001289 [Volvariella volvacea WC 439]
MDIDPLADAGPARHIIESDDEDEFNPLPHATEEVPPPEQVQVKLVGTIPKDKNKLVVATRLPGTHWARGADLGEQIGGVAVNGVQMGQLFTPEWTSSVVLVSEVLSRLPLWAMHPYVKAITDAFNPAKAFVLDLYPVSTYISSARPPEYYDSAPIRYLSTSTSPTLPSQYSPAEPFSPPNLVQGTSAAFLSHLAFHNPDSTALLVLLPSPTVPPPPPRTIPPANTDILFDKADRWSASTMNEVQKLLAGLFEEKVHEWKSDKSGKGGAEGVGVPMGKRRELGSESLYI